MTTDTPTTDTTTTTAAAPPTMTVGGRTFTLPFADLMPPQSVDERARLLIDIRTHGIRVPVVVTEADELLDGHHRLAIAAELGLPDVPVTVLTGLTAAEKRDYAESVNLHRRHLTRDQVQAIIARHLTADPAQSDRSLAAKAGIDHKTVGRARKKLVATGAVPQSTATRGKDGRTRPAKTGTPTDPAGKAAGPRGRTKPPAQAPAAESPPAAKRRRKPPPECPPDDIPSQSWSTAMHGVASDVHRMCAPLRRAVKWPASKRTGDKLRPLIAQLQQIVADLATVADVQDARTREKAGK